MLNLWKICRQSHEFIKSHVLKINVEPFELTARTFILTTWVIPFQNCVFFTCLLTNIAAITKNRKVKRIKSFKIFSFETKYYLQIRTRLLWNGPVLWCSFPRIVYDYFTCQPRWPLLLKIGNKTSQKITCV